MRDSIALAAACVLLLAAVILPGHLAIEDSAQASVLSWMSAAGLSPWTSYLQYGARLALLVAAGGIAIFKAQTIHAALQRMEAKGAKSRSLVNGIANVASLYLLIVLLINTEVVHPLATFMSYHEGELLGLVPTWQQWPFPLHHMLLIHGYGTDLLPAVLGVELAAPGSGIVAVRAMRFLIMIGLLVPGLYCLLGEMAKTARLHDVGMARLAGSVGLALTFGIVWSFGNNPLLDMPLRRVVLIWQMSVCLAVVHRPTSGRLLVLGTLLPVSLLWNVGDATIGFGVSLTALAVVAAQEPNRKLLWAALGLVISASFLQLVFPGTVVASLKMGTYWSQWGRQIWTEYLPDFGVDQFPWVMIVVEAASILAAIAAVKSLGVRRVVRAYGGQVILVISMLIATRIPLENGNGAYWGIADIFPTLVLIHLVFSIYSNRSKLGLSLPGGVRALAVVLAFLAVVIDSKADPFEAVNRTVDYMRLWNSPNSAVLDHNENFAVSRLRPLLGGQRCTVVLPSDASYYYLLGVPSCSRFTVSIYASPLEAQREMIGNLKREHPEFIIHDVPPHEISKGPPMKERLSLLYAWAAANYVPYKTVGGVSVWKVASHHILLPRIHP